MEPPFRLRIAKANCAKLSTDFAKSLIECFFCKEALLPMLVDAQGSRPGWASISEEEFIWAEEGYRIAVSSTHAM